MLKKLFLNDRFILALVLLNTISIFVGGYYRNSLAFALADALFTVLFVIEVIVKVRDLGWKAYWEDRWNRFDFIITMVAIPSLLNIFIEGSLATNILLSFRALRVFKSFRLFRFIPNIKEVLKGITLAIRASFIVAVGVAVLLLVVSILTSTLFGNIVPEYFGDPGTSLYNTFRLFTIEGWYDIPDLISQRSSHGMAVFARIYFVIELFIGGILGMSLINSIFVDAAVSDNNDDVKAELEEIKALLKDIQEKK